MVTPTTITNTDNTDMTDTDLTTDSTEPTMRLEECDEAFIRGVLLIKDAVLNYARHGLTPKQIGSRVRELGSKLSDSQVRRYLQGFRAEKLLPEKEQSQHPKAVASRRQRAANPHHAQMQPPSPEPTPAPLVTEQEPAWLANAPTPEELHAGFSTKWSEAVIEEIDTLFMLLDEFRCGHATATPEARKAMSTFAQSVFRYDQVNPYS